jgi:hypothetical protein
MKMIKQTVLAFLLLGASAQAQTYTVQKYGGQTILVPQGVIKSGPRSYSKFDPANPRRTAKDYSGKSGYQRATESRLPVVNRNGNGRVEPRGVTGGAIIIVNPYTR